MTEAAVAAPGVGRKKRGGQQAAGGLLAGRVDRARRFWNNPAVRRRLLLGLIAALPILIGAIIDAAHGWVAVGDYAATLVRARDVFSLHPPLIGQHTQAGHYIGRPVYTPGPIMYWLFALPTLVMQWWPAAPLIWSALFQTAMVLAIVWLADRIGGRSLSVLTAIGLLSLCVPAGARELYTIWNPYIAMLPLLLLAFVTVEIVLGRFQLLWLTALLATFVVQTYLTLAPGALLLSAIVAITVGIALVRWVHGGRDAPLHAGLHGRSLVATGLVLFICWLPPVVQQLKNSPGNLGLLWSATRAQPTNVAPSFNYGSLAGVERLPRIGLSSALATVANLVAYWPRRLVHRQDAVQASFAGPTGTRSEMLGVVTLVVMVGLIAIARWRRQRNVAAMGAAALALLVAAVVTAASEPTGPLSMDNFWGLVWLDVVAVFAWVTVAWALWCSMHAFLGSRTQSSREALVHRWRFVPVVTGLALLLVSLLVSIPGQRPDDKAWAYPFVRRGTAALRDGRRPYEIVSASPSPIAAIAGPGLLLALRVRSIPVGVPDDYVAMVGQRYRLPLGSRPTLVNPVEGSISPTGPRSGVRAILAMPLDFSERGRRVTAVIEIQPTGP